MDPEIFDVEGADVAWCPGCGDFPILRTLKAALAELEIDQKKLVLVSGIGQAGKLPHYLKSHTFNGLHGRALSPATAIKAVNRELTVIVTSGDGDMYGEGGNHLVHTIRRNPDITAIVHNNIVYGLTKGQASPTSQLEMKTSLQVEGVSSEPFNSLAVAIALNASFVARTFAGDMNHMKEVFKEAIKHKGFALVDVFQPCPTFNKTNTYGWFKDNTYKLEDSHDPHDRNEAFKRATETEKHPLGIFYKNENRLTFEETLSVYSEENSPLFERKN
ncbi:MAG: thiamine pyrophosphate-dependent enzyme [Methanobacteriaceae archaeon]|jgi:2-oxoglutarate ferredoxin oxidoreductase subunit beta